MVPLPFDMPKFIFWSPKACINKSSIPVQFCKPSWYLEKHYSWSQWELSLNLHCIGLCSLSSTNLHNGVHFQKKLYRLCTHNAISGWRRQKNRKESVGYLKKERRFVQYWHLGLKPWVCSTKIIGKDQHSNIRQALCNSERPIPMGWVPDWDHSIQKCPNLNIQV